MGKVRESVVASQLLVRDCKGQYAVLFQLLCGGPRNGGRKPDRLASVTCCGREGCRSNREGIIASTGNGGPFGAKLCAP